MPGRRQFESNYCSGPPNTGPPCNGGPCTGFPHTSYIGNGTERGENEILPTSFSRGKGGAQSFFIQKVRRLEALPALQIGCYFITPAPSAFRAPLAHRNPGRGSRHRKCFPMPKNGKSAQNCTPGIVCVSGGGLLCVGVRGETGSSCQPSEDSFPTGILNRTDHGSPEVPGMGFPVQG